MNESNKKKAALLILEKLLYLSDLSFVLSIGVIFGVLLGKIVPIIIGNQILSTCVIQITNNDDKNFSIYQNCYGKDNKQVPISKKINDKEYSVSALVLPITIGDLQAPYYSLFNLNTTILRKKLCAEINIAETEFFINSVLIAVEYQPDNEQESVFDLRDYGTFSDNHTCLFFDSDKINKIADPDKVIPLQFLFNVERKTEEMCYKPQEFSFSIHLRNVYGTKALIFSVVGFFLFLAITIHTIFTALKDIRIIINKTRKKLTKLKNKYLLEK